MFSVEYGFIMLMDVLMLIFGDEYGKLTLSSCFILSLVLGYYINKLSYIIQFSFALVLYYN